MDGQLGMDGVCMGHMEHGGMALKQVPKTFHVSVGSMFQVLSSLGIETHAELHIET